MSIAPGTRLGPYEVTAEIGAGGMGRVYRATDTNLRRQVAIKVLPDSVAGDADRLARFRREAEVLASLNHPNIAGIYGLEKGTGVTALVMEFVDGEDLSDVIARGLEINDALRIANQIADALEAAHEHGIIHRDLKPANVKVRADGTVKVLDFGLAKAMAPEGGHTAAGDIAHSPTVTSPALTRLGVILGTAAYMSPEQARGRAVDKRTDIWAFGCVLFEMLAGRRPFDPSTGSGSVRATSNDDGENIADVLAAIVKSEPSWALLPADTPPNVVRLLRRCLEKDQRRRLRDIGDVRLDLDEPAAIGLAPPPAIMHGRWPERLAWASLVGVLSAAGALSFFRAPHPAVAESPIARFSIALPEGQEFNGAGGQRNVAVSPDGKTIVYGANSQFYVRALDDPEARPIAGTNDSRPFDPVFSPSGRAIVFYIRDQTDARYKLKKVAVTGGPVLTLAEFGEDDNAQALTAPELTPAWSGDQIIGWSRTGIWTMSENGGERRLIVPMDTTVEVPSAFQLLDKGRRLLFTVRRVGQSGPQANSLVVQTIGTSERQQIVGGGARGVILPSGHLVYQSGASLLGTAFDEARLKVIGEPVVLASDVGSSWATSDVGTLLYQPAASAQGAPTIVWVTRSGQEEIITSPALPWVQHLRVSPDGSRIVLSSGGDVWIWTFTTRTMTRLSLTPQTTEFNPIWTPDAKRVVFDSNGSGNFQVLERRADGSGSASVVLEAPGGWPNAVSPDGRYLVFHKVGPFPALMVRLLAPLGPATPLTSGKGVSLNADFSPDGRWMTYQSAESGRAEVYVQPFPNIEAGRWQISTAGGSEPIWSHDGRELFFMSGARVLTAVPIDTRHGFVAGKPAALFPAGGYTTLYAVRHYDASPDGKRFVFTKSRIGAPSMTVVTNWYGEVRAKIGSQAATRDH